MESQSNTKDLINLTLGHKNLTSFIADQTPTPTRLIKNCEEVGLFDDLQHVNPFDETFRRAVQKSANVSGNITLVEEDTLHTPQVIYEDCKQSCEEFKVEKQKIILSESLPDKKRKIEAIKTDESIKQKKFNKISKLKIKSNLKSSNLETFENEKCETNKFKNIFPNNRMPLMIQPQVITLGYAGQNVTNIQSGNTLILPKPPSTKTNVINNEEKKIFSIKEKLKAIVAKSCANINSDKLHKHENSILDKVKVNNDCLQRKRAAAMRYRKKKNEENCALKKRNAELLSENLQLKEIVKQLQHKLLNQHAHCNITEKELKKYPNGITAQMLLQTMPAIHIPSSTIVVNIPKLIVHPNGQIWNNDVNKCNENYSARRKSTVSK